MSLASIELPLGIILFLFGCGFGIYHWTLSKYLGTSTYNTTGLPVSEFARYMPFSKRFAVGLLKSLLTSCVVGNLFLPGRMSNVSLQLDKNDSLVIKGKYNENVPLIMEEACYKLRKSFFKLGGVMIPGSFRIGKPGSDIHYSVTLPMRKIPNPGETDSYGELNGAAGIHLVDGSSLVTLPAKSHTFTIMANADRISKYVAACLKKS